MGKYDELLTAYEERSVEEDIHFTKAIECEIKGKGLMKTYEVKHQES